MLLLAFDTATPAVTVALHDGVRVLAETATVDPRRHGELLAPAIAAVLAAGGADRRELTAIGVGLGPGPFTGLRVGVVTAAVLADTLGLPAYGACSLDALAVGVPGPVVVATDARRREVYWAGYDAAGARTAGPAVQRPADVPLAGRPVLGPAVALYPELLPGTVRQLRAGALAGLLAARAGRDEPADRLTPLYLRRPDAVAPGRPKAVTPA